MAGRDSQDVNLPAIQPTTANARESQDVTLPAALPTSAKARESQDVALPAALPTTAKVRESQDVVLAAVSNNLLLQLHIKKPITAWIAEPEAQRPPRGGMMNQAVFLAPPPPSQPMVPRMITAHRWEEPEQEPRPWVGRVPSPRRRGPSVWVIT